MWCSCHAYGTPVWCGVLVIPLPRVIAARLFLSKGRALACVFVVCSAASPCVGGVPPGCCGLLCSCLLSTITCTRVSCRAPSGSTDHARAGAPIRRARLGWVALCALPHSVRRRHAAELSIPPLELCACTLVPWRRPAARAHSTPTSPLIPPAMPLCAFGPATSHTTTLLVEVFCFHDFVRLRKWGQMPGGY